MTKEEFDEWFAGLTDKEQLRYLNGQLQELDNLQHSDGFPTWFHAALYVAETPDRHNETYYRTPLLVVLAYADAKAKKERERIDTYNKAAKKGNPLALMFLLMH